jgi:hypothetical protein
MTLNDSGNLLVGTTTNKLRLTVSGTVVAGPVLGTASGTAFFANSDPAYGLMFGSTGGGQSWMQVQRTDGSATAYDLWLQPSGGNVTIGKTAASETYTTGSGFGFAAPAIDPFFSIVNANASGANASIYLNQRTTAGFAVFIKNNGSSQSAIGSISNGTTSVGYNTTSDYRLKNTITPMTGALSKVALLKPCIYKWNLDGSDGEGFIAHELAEVCPNAVAGEKDAVDKDGNPQYQGVDTSFLVATLTAAIQELKSIIDQQDARIKTLEGNV